MFYGIENLSKDGEGYVYWNGKQIDHYSFYGKEEEEKAAAQDLANRCNHLEKIGIPVTCSTAIWYWDWYKSMEANDPMAKLLLSGSFYERNDRSALAISLDAHFYTGTWIKVENGQLEIMTGLEVREDQGEAGFYHAMRRIGYTIPDCGQNECLGMCYADLSGVKAMFAHHGISNSDLISQIEQITSK